MLKKTLISFVLFFVFLFLFFSFSSINGRFPEHKLMKMKIGNQKYDLFVSNTIEKRIKGLSNSPYILRNEGMIFIYENPGIYKFWMKSMNYPIDIIYVYGNIVIDIFENVSPDSYPNLIIPNNKADKVIELNAGEVERNGIKIGSSVLGAN